MEKIISVIEYFMLFFKVWLDFNSLSLSLIYITFPTVNKLQFPCTCLWVRIWIISVCNTADAEMTQVDEWFESIRYCPSASSAFWIKLTNNSLDHHKTVKQNIECKLSKNPCFSEPINVSNKKIFFGFKRWICIRRKIVTNFIYGWLWI